jgi:hypothetical protein
MVYSVGTYLDEEAQRIFVTHVLGMATVKTFEAPAGVEIATRVDPAGKAIYFVINHTPEGRFFALPWPAFDHLAHREVRELALDPYGVALLTRSD